MIGSDIPIDLTTSFAASISPALSDFVSTTIMLSGSPSLLSNTSLREVESFLWNSVISSLQSTRSNNKSHCNDSSKVAWNASNKSDGRLSMNQIVSANRIRGLNSILPTVVSNVENNLSSTNTSLPDNARNKEDFPALV